MNNEALVDLWHQNYICPFSYVNDILAIELAKDDVHNNKEESIIRSYARLKISAIISDTH